ncbi:MAG: hypothetical protein R3F65_13230 [bacterium]
MLRTLILLALVALPAAALADPPTDAELEAAAAALPTPALSARLHARAAAWRAANGAAATLGLDRLAERRAAAPAEPPVVVAQNARR